MKTVSRAILLMIASVHLSAQVGTITGHVYREGGSLPGGRAPGATVHLSIYRYGLQRETTTDSNGRFVFLGVPADSLYRLEATSSGLSSEPQPLGYLYWGQIQSVPLMLRLAPFCGTLTEMEPFPSEPGVFRIRECGERFTVTPN
jgi:hypothetical protein